MSRRDLFPASHSLTLLAMMAANVAAAIWLPVLCWATIPLAALAMTGALSVVHEASHAIYFSSRMGNSVVGRMFALLILVNFSLYRRDHMLHHAHLGTDRDSEAPKQIRSKRDLLVTLLVNSHALAHWRESFVRAFSVNRSSALGRDAWLLAVVLVAVVGATWIWPPMVLAFWLPLLMSLFLDNVVSLPEHAVCGQENGGVLTRSIAANSLTSFLLYYVNQHAEHHSQPKISAACRRSTNAEWRVSYVGFYRDLLSRL